MELSNSEKAQIRAILALFYTYLRFFGAYGHYLPFLALFRAS